MSRPAPKRRDVVARGRRGDDVIDRLDVGAVQTTLRDARRANNPLAVIVAAGQHATGGRLRGGAGDDWLALERSLTPHS